MQMRRTGTRVPAGSHEPDHLPAFHPHTLVEAFRVPVEMSVVVTIHTHFIECVDRIASRFAEKQLADGSGYDGMYRRSPRAQKINRVVRMPGMNFIKRISHLRQRQSINGRHHLEQGGTGPNTDDCHE